MTSPSAWQRPREVLTVVRTVECAEMSSCPSDQLRFRVPPERGNAATGLQLEGGLFLTLKQTARLHAYVGSVGHRARDNQPSTTKAPHQNGKKQAHFLKISATQWSRCVDSTEKPGLISSVLMWCSGLGSSCRELEVSVDMYTTGLSRGPLLNTTRGCRSRAQVK